MIMETNKIYTGHALEILKTFPDEFVDCVITSPPYWNLRNYRTNPVVWGGSRICEHEWGEEILTGQQTAQTKYQAAREAFTQSKSAFCKKCGAWLGELGAEPDPDLFVSHLGGIFDEVKRVLKSTGSCWVNIADTYGGSGGAGGDYNKGGLREGQPRYRGNNYQAKSLVGIPERFVLEMQRRNWIRRNTIWWHKPNTLPSSATDRFSVDGEYFYFFTKNKNYYFNQQFEAYTEPINRWGGETLRADGESLWDEGTGQSTYRKRSLRPNPEGRNMRCLWSINTEQSRVKHWASFPRKLVQTPIEATCPPGGVVLDHFCGSGTVCRVAYDLQRKYIGIDLSPEFVEISERRLDQRSFLNAINTKAVKDMIESVEKAKKFIEKEGR